jgi:outer membrane protein OmpA-like peptidoglycan-associated protein
MIKNFEPYPEFIIKDELGNRICPPMPEIVDSTELYVDVEQLVYVPESMPVGFEIVLHNVSFGAGQSTFSNPGENKDIQNLLQALKEQLDLKLEIGGYTDNTGAASKNIEISAKRAKFIYDYLIKQGIAENRLSYKGYGPAKPLYSNRYSSTREGNRRIEVKITDKKKEDYSKLIEEAINDDRNKTSMMPEPTLADLFAPSSVVPINAPIVITSIVYEPNMIEVPEAAKADLNELAGWMRTNPSFKLEVSSHTDKSGLEELNELLSTQRAEAVYNYLIEQGAPQNQLTFKGYGSSKPIASNKYQHGKEKNRRVEIKILEIVD